MRRSSWESEWVEALREWARIIVKSDLTQSTEPAQVSQVNTIVEAADSSDTPIQEEWEDITEQVNQLLELQVGA